MDIIRVPFGYLLDWLCRLSGNYGVALILFSLIIKIILLPMSAKGKKSMLKMSRVSPRVKALEAQFGENKERYQQEVMKLYKAEGVSTTAGCLWSFIPLLIILPLYYVIREPITYMMHFDAETAKRIVEVVGQNVALKSQSYYHQLEAASYLGQFRDAIIAAIPNIDALKLQVIDFKFLGVDLSALPQWRFWLFRTGSDWGLFLIPLLSAASQVVSMLVTQKLNNRVVTDDSGQQDELAIATNNQTSKSMMYLMPAMSLWFCFIMPAAISIYWVAQAVFGLIQDVFLTRYYGGIYDREDAQKQQRAAEEEARVAERSRLREERLAKLGELPHDPNTSKKKLKQKEKVQLEEARQEYESAKLPKAAQAQDVETVEEGQDDVSSGDPERPFSRGRAYKEERYRRK